MLVRQSAVDKRSKVTERRGAWGDSNSECRMPNRGWTRVAPSQSKSHQVAPSPTKNDEKKFGIGGCWRPTLGKDKVRIRLRQGFRRRFATAEQASGQAKAIKSKTGTTTRARTLL